MSYKPIVVEKDKIIKLKERKRIPYMEILSLIIQGEDVFIECNRKIAYYIKRKLSSILEALDLNIDIESYPSIIKIDDKEKEGYIFRMVKIGGGGGVILVDKRSIIEKIDKLIEQAEGELKVIKEQQPDRTLSKIEIILKTRIETLKEIKNIIEQI